jgi:cytochrome c-type biogenesis protein CcmH
MQNRRQFILSGATGVASILFARTASAMTMQQVTQSFAGPMEQDAYRPVNLAPLAAATKPSMSDEQRDALEHQIKCQCGCVLDVYTCRTTDFSCGVSPAMHDDVVKLVASGYNGEQILTAFQSVYGEQILMAPLKRGFNLVGYALPSVALLTAGALVARLIKRWGAREREVLRPAGPTLDATPDELAALNSAVRDDS